MQDRESTDGLLQWFTAGRVLILAVVAVLLVVGLILVAEAIEESRELAETHHEVNALAESDNECVVCHRRATVGIVEQYGRSSMAAAEVACEDCHEVAEDYAGAVEHEGTWVIPSPTTAMCDPCHSREVREFNFSRHGIPAYAAMVGLDGLTPEQLDLFRQIPEAQPEPNQTRNALYAIEGADITRFACQDCHNIGLPAADGSVGQCQKCHVRHEFSLEQARKPETCNHCHIGPDHPQWEIYQESYHGISYATDGQSWNWDAEVGTLTVEDFPAATCAICHMSGFGATGTTHDVGERLSWYLFSPVSQQRPTWEENRARMKSVCATCHNEEFLNDFYGDADALTLAVNGLVTRSQETLLPLKDAGLLTKEPFDEPIDFVSFELWHHWGRTAKFGAWMQGPDYTQWHGAYEMLADQAELEEMVDQKLEGSAAATQPASGQ